MWDQQEHESQMKYFKIRKQGKLGIYTLHMNKK